MICYLSYQPSLYIAQQNGIRQEVSINLKSVLPKLYYSTTHDYIPVHPTLKKLSKIPAHITHI